METETIADIVNDIRAQNLGLREDGYALSPLVSDLLLLADRIEAAHWNETVRLRRALKPVLDCHLCDGGQQVVSDALCAIREAKEIMKGENND